MTVYDSSVLEQLGERVARSRRQADTLLVGIDGPGGSGKSTLARELASVVPNAVVVHVDDFYRPAAERLGRAASGDDELGGDFDWRRLRDQVLRPLRAGLAARYQRYDWERDELGDWLEPPPSATVIVEGSYATRPELRACYSLTIWVEAPREVRLRRGLERDGEGARARWLEDWMPEEDRYVEAHAPARRADVVVDGAPSSG